MHYDENEKLLAVLLESIPGGIDAKAETVSFLLKQFGEVRTLSDEEADRLGPLTPPEVADEVVLKDRAPRRLRIHRGRPRPDRFFWPI